MLQHQNRFLPAGMTHQEALILYQARSIPTESRIPTTRTNFLDRQTSKEDIITGATKNEIKRNYRYQCSSSTSTSTTSTILFDLRSQNIIVQYL